MSNGMLRAMLRGMLRILSGVHILAEYSGIFWHILAPSDELTRVVLFRVMAVGSVQAVGYGMTKSLRTLTSQLTYYMLGETRHRVPRAELN